MANGPFGGNKPAKPPRTPLQALVYWGTVLGIWGLIFVVAFFAVFARDLPDTSTLYDASSLELAATVPDTVDLAEFGYPDRAGETTGAPVEAVFSPDGKHAYVSQYSLKGPGAGETATDDCAAGDAIGNSAVYRLDLETKDMLIQALKNFEGTMIFVSHDRAFLRGLSNRVLELGGESGVDTEPHAYPGSYVEYVARTGHEAPGVHA